MRTTVILAVLLTFLLLCGALAAQEVDYVPGQILVKFKQGTPASEMAAAHRQNNARVMDEIWQIGVQKVKASKGQEIALMKRYARNPNVEFVELDLLVYPISTIPNDPVFATGHSELKRIQAPEAWDISTGDPTVMVGLVDTGVNYLHEDLQGRLVNGYNFYSYNTDCLDEIGHGTHLAGIIGAATDNGIGVSGFTWQNPILPIKLCGSTGYTTSSTLAQGVTYSAERGARVINVSWAFSSASSTMKNAIDYVFSKGVVVVGGTGNNGVQGIAYPAAYSNVIAVGAADSYDQRASYSNYGPGIDVLAPGSGISTTRNGGYGSMGGTSVATAYASGLCALILSANPALSPTEVMQIVRESADDIAPAGWDEYTGYGRINAYKALASATANTSTQLDPEPLPEPEPEPTPDTTPPSVTLVDPSDGATVSGALQMSAEASDDTAVAKVEYYVDGKVVAASFEEPFAASWDTTAAASGAKSVIAKAIDQAGNSATSLPVSVTVSNSAPITCTFTGTLNKKNTVGLHSVTISTPSAVTALLAFKNNADLNLHVLDCSNREIASATGKTAQPETLSVALSAGKYTFKVEAVSGTSAYTLEVASEGQ